MMAENKTELVNEIEVLIKSLSHEWYLNWEHDSVRREEVVSTLQRAREALRWIPCEERLPEREGYYLVTYETGSVEIDYFYGDSFDCHPSCPVIAWKERTILAPYTPPKTVVSQIVS